MNTYIKINETELVPFQNIKRICKITEEERISLDQLGDHVDASRFNIRLDYAGGSKSYAPETLDMIVGQGVSLVEIAPGAYVPGGSIIKVRDITDKDRTAFWEKTGRRLRDDFQSQVTTKAGMVLATVPADKLIERMDQNYQPVTVKPKPPTKAVEAPVDQDDRPEAAMA